MPAKEQNLTNCANCQNARTISECRRGKSERTAQPNVAIQLRNLGMQTLDVEDAAHGFFLRRASSLEIAVGTIDDVLSSLGSAEAFCETGKETANRAEKSTVDWVY